MTIFMNNECLLSVFCLISNTTLQNYSLIEYYHVENVDRQLPKLQSDKNTSNTFLIVMQNLSHSIKYTNHTHKIVTNKYYATVNIKHGSVAKILSNANPSYVESLQLKTTILFNFNFQAFQ